VDHLNVCKRCQDFKRKVIAKDLCNRCYYATKNNRETYREIVKKRNYIENNFGILTSKNGEKWRVDLSSFHKCKNILWSDNGNGYAKSGGVFLHRFLRPNLEMVDHIDRDKSNNLMSNLRDGTGGVNNFNKVVKHGVSGERNIHKMRNKWQVKVGRKYIGTFSNVGLAIISRDNYLKTNKIEAVL